VVEPVIRRMLASRYAAVRETGGFIAVYAGLELGLSDFLTTVRNSPDAWIRTGAARCCAVRLPVTTDVASAAAALSQFVEDTDDGVRKAAAKVAGSLRDKALRRYRDVITVLVASPSFDHALSQLLITLEHATDRVDDLVLQTARRFSEVHGINAANIATGAAGEARELGQLIIRAYAQADTIAQRHAVLDLLDDLLLVGAYGIAELVAGAER
jgi:hypothetical protein